MAVQSDVCNLCVVVLFAMLGVWILSTLGRIRMALEAYACAKKNSDGGGNMYIATMNKLRQQTFREIVEERDTMQRQGAHLLVPSMTLPCKLQSTSETVATLRQRRNNNITSNNNSNSATAQRQQSTRDQQQQQYQSSPRSNGGESATTAARGHSRELSLFSSASSTASQAGGPAGAVVDVPIGSSASNKFQHQPQHISGGGGGCSAASAPGVYRIIRLLGSVLAPMSALLLGRPPANHATAPSSPLATSINQPPSRLRRINSTATQFGGAETTTVGSTVRGDDEEDDADSVTTHYFAGPVVNSAGKGGRSGENSKPLLTSRPRSSGGSTGGGGGGGGSTLMPSTSAFALAAPAYESVNNSTTVVMSVFLEHDKALAGAAIRFFQQPGSPSGAAATLRSISVNREELPATSRAKRTTTAQQQAPLMTTASSTASAINRLPRELSSEEVNILFANTLGGFGGAAVHSAGPPSRYLLPAALGIQTDQQQESATLTTATAAAASSATTANETKQKQKQVVRPPPLEPFTRPSQHNTTTGGAFEPPSVLFGSVESVNGGGGGGARAASMPTPSSHLLLPSLRVHVLLTSRELLEEELLYNATMFRRDQHSLFLTGHGAPQLGLGSMPASNRVRGATSHITVVQRNAAAAASSTPNHNEGDPSSPMRICRRDGAVRGGRCRCRLRGFQLEQPLQRHHTTAPSTTFERDDSNPIFAATPLSPYDAGGTSSFIAASNNRTASQHQRHTAAAAHQSRHNLSGGEKASSGDFGPCTSAGTISGANDHNSSSESTYLEALRVALTEEEWTEVSNVAANAIAAGAEDNSCVRVFLVMEQNGSGICGAGGSGGVAAAASASAIFSPSTTSRMRRHYWTAEEGGGGHPLPPQPTEFSSATFRSTTATAAGPTFLDEPPGAEDSMMQFHRGGVHTTRSGGTAAAPPPRETPLTPHPSSDQQQLFSGTYSSSVFSPTGGPAGVTPNNNINSTGSGNYYNNSASCSFIAELQFQRVTTATPNVIVVNAANAERCASGGGDSVVLRGTQSPTSTTTTMLPQQQVHTPPPERIHFPGSAQKVSKTTVSFAGGLASATADDAVVRNATTDEAIPSSSNNMPINSSGSLSLLRGDALAATLAGDDNDVVLVGNHLCNSAPAISDKEAPSRNDGCGETRKDSELIFSTPTSTIFPREITFEFHDDIERRGGEENSQQQDCHRPLHRVVPSRTSTPPTSTTHLNDDATVVAPAAVRSPTQRSLTTSTRSQLQPPSPPPPIDEELPSPPQLLPSNVTDAAVPLPVAVVVPDAAPTTTSTTKAALPQLRLSSVPPSAVDTVDGTQHAKREYNNNNIGNLAALVVPHLLIPSTTSATSAASSTSAVVLEQGNNTTVPTAAADATASSSATIQTLHTADVEPSFSYCRVGHRVYRVEPIFAVHEEAEEEEDNNGSEEQYAAAASNFSPTNGNGGRGGPALSRRHGGSAADLIEMSELQPAAAQQVQPHQQQHPLCMICFHRPSTVILLPCQHFGFCVFCVRRLRHCPVCRQQIDHTLFLLEDVV